MRIIRYKVVREIRDVPDEKPRFMTLGEGLLIIEDDHEHNGEFIPDSAVTKIVNERDPHAIGHNTKALGKLEVHCERKYAEVKELPEVISDCTVIRMTLADIAKYIPEAAPTNEQVAA